MNCEIEAGQRRLFNTAIAFGIVCYLGIVSMLIARECYRTDRSEPNETPMQRDVEIGERQTSIHTPP